MNIERLRNLAKPADIILISGSGFLSSLIKYAQKVITPTGKPSLWSHVCLYINEQTIWESTIDFKPYHGTGKRLDNGVQYNDINNLADIKVAMLLQFPFTDQDRQDLLLKADDMAIQGYTYPITGLIGSMLSYWLFGWGSNPLQSKHSLYCSAAVQEVYAVKGIDFSGNHTSRNTAPEHIYRYKNQDVNRIWLT